MLAQQILFVATLGQGAATSVAGTNLSAALQQQAARGITNAVPQELVTKRGFFYSLNAPMSGAGVRSTEASAPLAG